MTNTIKIISHKTSKGMRNFEEDKDIMYLRKYRYFKEGSITFNKDLLGHMYMHNMILCYLFI